MFDRQAFFDSVRGTLFGGALTQRQVDGMDAKLTQWERNYAEQDHRWLANSLAQNYHETSKEMWPIEEYGKGEGMEYGHPDPKTGETYYGRGDIQLTWADNYLRADNELGLEGDDSCYIHADNALRPDISANIMFEGMINGWFRNGHDLPRYFNEFTDDPYGAREIVNGDKTHVPTWSGGKSIGTLIKEYHYKFLAGLDAAIAAEVARPEITARYVITVRGRGPFSVTVEEE